MRRIVSLCCTFMFAATVMLAGCDRENKTKTTEKVSNPGGTTTTTTEKKVESSGDNPPPNSQGESVPKK